MREPDGRSLGEDPLGLGRRLRLAFVTEWFPPEPDGVPLWVAEALREQGLNVGVVTGVPHYPSGIPSPGYKRSSWGVERARGFATLRVPEYSSHDTSAIRRIATLGSFAVSSALLATRAVGQADVTLVYSSPATSALAAMTARFRYDTPYVLFVQDLWPDSIFATGFFRGRVAKLLARPPSRRLSMPPIGGRVYICVITPGMVRLLVERGVPQEKVSLVYNWVDEQVFKPTTRSGTLRSELGIDATHLLPSLRAILERRRDSWHGSKRWRSSICMMRISSFLAMEPNVSHSRPRPKSSGVQSSVHFVDSVPLADVPGLSADADVSIISLADDPLFQSTMPSKVQAAFAMAQPVIASCDGDVGEVVRESGAGWVARPDDPLSIARQISAARSVGSAERRRRGELGRHYCVNMAREIGSRRRADGLRSAVLDHRAPQGTTSSRGTRNGSDFA